MVAGGSPELASGNGGSDGGNGNDSAATAATATMAGPARGTGPSRQPTGPTSRSGSTT